MDDSPAVWKALAGAIRTGDVATASRLLAHDDVLKQHLDQAMPGGHFGATPLLSAVYAGNLEMVDVLLAAGADINARSDWWAGSFGVLDHDGPLSDYLVERGATIDVHAASRLGRLDVLRTLLTADPSLVRARGGDGQTPLHFAASIPVAEYLLAHGAVIDARDVDHESTPAQWMIRGRTDVARYLVTRGCATDLLLAAALGDRALIVSHLAANPALIRMTVSDEFFPKADPRSGGTIYTWTLGAGKNPHIVARNFGHADAFAMLMESSSDELKLTVWCELGEAEEVSSLLSSHPQLSQRLGEEGLHKLPDAARDGNRVAVTLMLAAGWPVDARGQHGGTALHWAAWNGDADLTRELLRHGPPLEVTDLEYKGTPLFWAIYGSMHGWRCRTGNYAGVVEVLLNSGAQPPQMSSALEASTEVRQLLERWVTGGAGS
ncbi:MAG: ankyrin repeat domain-containing protein [Vicinamibacterales bacterium]